MIKQISPSATSVKILHWLSQCCCRHVQTNIQCSHFLGGISVQMAYLKIVPKYNTEMGKSIFNTNQHIGLKENQTNSLYCICLKTSQLDIIGHALIGIQKRNWQKCCFVRKREFIHSYYCYFLFWKRLPGAITNKSTSLTQRVRENKGHCFCSFKNYFKIVAQNANGYVRFCFHWQLFLYSAITKTIFVFLIDFFFFHQFYFILFQTVHTLDHTTPFGVILLHTHTDLFLSVCIFVWDVKLIDAFYIFCLDRYQWKY